jgi:hypothetical protein
VGETGALFMPAVVVGVVYATYLLVATHEAARRRKRRAMLSAAWGAMEAASADLSSMTVTGLAGGLPASFCLRGDAAHLELDLPATGFVVAVQARLVPARAALEAGAVATGDAAFDGEYFVEGAPADVVRSLLTPDLRARLLAARPVAFTISGQALELRALSTIAPATVAELVGLAAAIGAAAGRAVEEADRKLSVATGSPYRTEVDATAVHAAQSARAAEVDAFVEIVHERAAAARRALLLAAVLAVILVVSFYASGS